MFEGDSADMWAGKFPLMSLGVFGVLKMLILTPKQYSFRIWKKSNEKLFAPNSFQNSEGNFPKQLFTLDSAKGLKPKKAKRQMWILQENEKFQKRAVLSVFSFFSKKNLCPYV